METQRKKVLSMLNHQPAQKNLRLRKQTRDSNYITTDDCYEDYIVLDFETTGPRAGADKIIGILAIRYEEHKEVDQFETLINPQRHIPLEITQLTGISADEVSSSPTMQEILPTLVSFIGELPIVIHDSSFEMGFLESLHDFSEIQLPKYTVVDTSKLARKVTAKLEKIEQLHKLEYLLEAKENTYTGTQDCRTTAAIYEFCCQFN